MMTGGENPNIILVTVDSLRADRCGFMGCDKGLTPALDRLAGDGIVFENAIAPGPATPESMPVIFTGSYPVPQSGNGDQSELERERQRIRHHMSARDTLAEKLSRQGYTTGAFTPNPFTSRYFNFDQGFDHFEDFMGESRSSGGLYERVFKEFVEDGGLASTIRPMLNLLQQEEAFKSWESFYDEVITWNREATEPYFLWIMLMDVHNPYLVPGEYRSQSAWAMWHGNWRMFREDKQSPFPAKIERRLVTAYEDAIRYVDDFFHRLQSDIEDTTLIVTSDHGEAFGEHGTYGHEPRLHEENIHVPLIVTGDGIKTGRFREPLSLQSLPALLNRIGAGDEEKGVGDLSVDFATARTYKGDALALRWIDWQFIDDGSDASVFSVGETRTYRGNELEQLCQNLAQQQREEADERRRVNEQADQLARQGGI